MLPGCGYSKGTFPHIPFFWGGGFGDAVGNVPLKNETLSCYLLTKACLFEEKRQNNKIKIKMNVNLMQR